MVLEKLPAQHVDTGMGFERLCGMQNTTSNYDTDVFTPLIQKWEITGLKYTPNSVILNDSEESEEQNKTNIAIRVIVDHVRAVASLLLTDNCLPIQEQDSRILRRAIRYGFTFEYQRTFYLSVAVLADQMGEVFPEIRKQQGLVTNVIREEETSFAYTGSRVSC
jgi:alanyl-tRNA synthetase